MKILLLISEVWNDSIHPNNTMSNWFSGMEDIEIATIYASPGEPQNNCCKKYFRVTETDMVKSLYGKPAGKILLYDKFPNLNKQDFKIENQNIYKSFKRVSNEFIRLIRDVIWATGKYNKSLLKQFIEDFSPDIIFTQRRGSIKMCRIERMVMQLTNIPIVAFTGDDEYTLKQISYSPIFWLRRLWIRHELRKNIPKYKLFYAHSEEQLKEFRNKFNSNTKFLAKCGNFDKSKIHTKIHSPIILSYAGKLYCNRWKTLAIIAKYIKEINKDDIKVKLNIYTKDVITKEQNKCLNDGVNSSIVGPLAPDKFGEMYDNSDIVLHVESFDLKNHLAVKYSFSTKIIDCLASGCAVMAIGREGQAGCEYLRCKNAAMVASNENEIQEWLNKIINHPEMIIEYANKAYECGMKNHQKETVQKNLYRDLENNAKSHN